MDVPVIMQRQVPQLQTVAEDSGNPDTVHRKNYGRPCDHAATGPSASDGVEDCGGPAGAFRRQKNASPLVLARDAPAEKPEPPPQGSGLRERLDAGDDETSVPSRYPCIPPSSVEKPWPALKRDGQLIPNPFQPFLRPQQQWRDPRVTVTLTKPMGMTLEARPNCTGAFVSKLVEGSAAQSGQVHVGDVILRVAGRDVFSYSLQEVVEAIRAVPQGVTLQLLRAA